MRRLLMGEFGHPPAAVDPARARGGRGHAAGRVRRPSLAAAREEAGELATSEEDLCLVALFGDDATPLLEGMRGRRVRSGEGAGRVDDAETARVRRLVGLLAESEAAELTIEDDGGAHHRAQAGARAPAAPVIALPHGWRRPWPSARRPSRPPTGREPGGLRIESPMVGTFYRASSPEVAALRRGGRPRRGRPDALHPRGDEALQRAQVRPRRRRSAAILVENADPVEFGQPLFELDAGLMFSRVLVANRGEIAVRVIRACHELGIEAVGRLLDGRPRRAWRRSWPTSGLHRPAAGRPELPRDPERRSPPAQTTGCDAVHPGYGFLSENAAFARAVRRARPDVHRPDAGVDGDARQQGARASSAMRARACRCVPGSDGPAADADEAQAPGRARSATR